MKGEKMDYLNAIKDFIKPELIVLIPVLYFVGVGIRKSKKVKNEYIPILLGIVGISLGLIYVLATSDLTNYQNILLALFTAITQGILVAGTSVFVNQLIKQKKYLEDTEHYEEVTVLPKEGNTDSAEVK